MLLPQKRTPVDHVYDNLLRLLTTAFWFTQTLHLKTWFVFSSKIADQHDLARPLIQKSMSYMVQKLHPAFRVRWICLWKIKMQCVPCLMHSYFEILQ